MTADPDSLPTVWSDDRLELGEGARWYDGQLYVVDLLAGRLLMGGSGDRPGLQLVLDVGQPLAAAAQRRGHPGSWVLATGTGLAVVDGAGRLEWLGKPEEGNRASARMNDGSVDGRGRFWVGSKSDEVGAGSLYRLGADGGIVRILDGLTIANGPAFSPDGRWMYLADSAAGSVDRFSIRDDGELGEREPFVRLAAASGPPDGATGSPDGMTVDVEGHLWLAVWGGGAVHRYRPDGSLAAVLRVPATQPTSVCLGGPDGHRLFITSAHVGLSGPSPFDGALFSTIAPAPGQPAVATILS